MNKYVLLVIGIIISVGISFLVARGKMGPQGTQGPRGLPGIQGKIGHIGPAGGAITFGNLAQLSAQSGVWGSGTNRQSTKTLGPNKVQKAEFRQQMSMNTVNYLLGRDPATGEFLDPCNQDKHSLDYIKAHCPKNLMNELSEKIIDYIAKKSKTKPLDIIVKNAVHSNSASKASHADNASHAENASRAGYADSSGLASKVGDHYEVTPCRCNGVGGVKLYNGSGSSVCINRNSQTCGLGR